MDRCAHSRRAERVSRIGNTRPRFGESGLRSRRASQRVKRQDTSGVDYDCSSKLWWATVFTQTDPAPLGAGTAFESAYVYGLNNPVMYTDPSGLRGSMPGQLAQRSPNPLLPNRAELDPGELKHQKGIEKWAKVNGLNPLLLAALMYHEGGEYIGSAARRQVAKRADRYSSSKGMMQIQNGTAKQVLDEIYNEDPPKHLDRKLINDDDFSLKVAAGYLRLLSATYSISGDRSLFLAYSASPNSIQALKQVGFDPDLLSTDDGTKRGSALPVPPETRNILMRRNDEHWPAAVQAVKSRVV